MLLCSLSSLFHFVKLRFSARVYENLMLVQALKCKSRGYFSSAPFTATEAAQCNSTAESMGKFRPTFIFIYKTGLICVVQIAARSLRCAQLSRKLLSLERIKEAAQNPGELLRRRRRERAQTVYTKM
jgi:hypothetical protein